MHGIRFGDMHSWDDLKMILNSKEIGAPDVKETKINVPGADGSLDLADFFGEPKYGDVTHKFHFSTIVPHREFLTQYSTIKNAIHGKKMRVILDDDPLFYWMGRCHVSGFKDEKGIGRVDVDCICEPYKYKIAQTAVTQAVSGTAVINLTNGRKRAVPTITTTAPMTISFGGGSWANSAGTYTIPELELTHGENTVTVTGTGTISFTWQEGDM
jgi:phage-related protein